MLTSGINGLVRDRMHQICEYAFKQAQQYKSHPDMMHWDICSETATKFDLWDKDETGDETFPTWLSRVVEGLMNDVQWGDTEYSR